MSRRLKSKYSVCKKLNNVYKNLWGLQCKDYVRSVFNKKKKNISSFGEILNIKQSLKFFYSNIKERCFIQYVKIAISSNSIAINKIISILESRLDSVLFRSCFVNSFHQARQLINHGFVTINGIKVNSCNKRLKKGDIIKLSSKFIKTDLFSSLIKSSSLCNH